MDAGVQMDQLIYSIPELILLAGGILLLSKREREETRPALFVLLCYSVIACLQSLSGYLQFPAYSTWVGMTAQSHAIFIFQTASFFITIMFNLMLVLMIVSFLFMPRNRKLIRGVALAAIVMAGLRILWGGLSIMQLDSSFFGAALLMAIKHLFHAILPIALLLFAWIFFSRKEQSTIE